MNKKDTTLPVRYLKPGELFITDKPFFVKTVLDSCLTITMFSPRARLSAICHAVLNDAKTKAKSEAEQFIHAHGGHISIDSQSGQGTCVTVSLPLD